MGAMGDQRAASRAGPAAARLAWSALGCSLLLALVAIGSLVVRWWHAGGVERQQLKWFVYARTVQPAASSLWLRPAGPRPGLEAEP